MADKIALDLAASTEELAASPLTELTEAEISVVAGGIFHLSAEG